MRKWSTTERQSDKQSATLASVYPSRRGSWTHSWKGASTEQRADVPEKVTVQIPALIRVEGAWGTITCHNLAEEN